MARTRSNAERQRRYRQRNADKVAEYEISRQTNHNRTRRMKHMTRPFVGVDGEGENLDNGYHAYNLLTCGTESIVPKVFERRLRTTDCLSFLADQPPDNVYVGYFFDYDVAKILEDLPWSKLDKLIHRESRVRLKGGYFPVEFDGFQFDYFPKKEFKVRRIGAKSWVTIFDVGSFFQCPFIKALRQWGIGTEEEQDKIAAGKDLRAVFATVPFEIILEYNLLECRMLAELMTDFRDVCIELDMVPKKWTGPGQIAEKFLEQNGIPRVEDIPLFQLDPYNPDVKSHRDLGTPTDPVYGVAAFGRYSFYGPWFEISRIGYTSVPCVQWDINSAFPDALRYAPCLIHGEWERVTEKRTVSEDELSICFGSFKPDPESKDFLYGGFSVRRKDGSIYRPENGRGWYWSFEIRAAIHQIYTVYDSWIYHKKCDCEPYAFIEPWYEKRRALGKATKGYPIKLALNSLYGKTLQSIGDPHYSNPIHASFITAYTRTKLMEMIHVLLGCLSPDRRVPCGADVYMVASDALVVRPFEDEDVAFDMGPRLGQFDKEVRPNGLFQIQPGVYFDPVAEDEETVYKTRGVPKAKVIERREEFLAAFRRMVETGNITDGTVRLDYRLMVGIKQALVRKNLKLLGQFIDYKDPKTGEPGRKVSFMWHSKRRPDNYKKVTRNGEILAIGLLPYTGFEDKKGAPSETGMRVQTVPYRKDIGGLLRNERMRLDFDNQPDWVQIADIPQD
jgi:hypothetical protein